MTTFAEKNLDCKGIFLVIERSQKDISHCVKLKSEVKFKVKFKVKATMSGKRPIDKPDFGPNFPKNS